MSDLDKELTPEAKLKIKKAYWEKINKLMATEVLKKSALNLRPATNIAHAYQAIDVCKQLFISVTKIPTGYSIDTYGSKSATVLAKTLEEVPMAICTLILKYKGVSF